LSNLHEGEGRFRVDLEEGIETWGQLWGDTCHQPCIHLMAGLLALLPRQTAHGGEGRQEDTTIAEKLFGPGEQRRHVLHARRLLDQEATKGLAGGSVERVKPQIEANLLLVRRDGRLTLSIILHSGRIHRQRVCHKVKQVVKDLQRLLGGKPACEVEEAHLIGKAQAVMRPATAGNPGMIGRGEYHPLGDELVRIMQEV
jgi:hypothetical protein